jgi:hypothetical protein
LKRCFKKNSPLSFKKFIVEESEVNKDKFIKTRALMPLIDGAFIYTKSIKGLTIRIPALNNWPLTILNIEIYLNCAEALDFIKIKNS